MKIKLTVESYALILYCSDLIASKFVPLTYDEWKDVEDCVRHNASGVLSRLFGASYDMLTQMLEIDHYIAEKIVNRNQLIGSLFHAVSFLEKEGIAITTRYEDNYPTQFLKMERKAPAVLYYVGDMHLVKEPNISIVGPQKNIRRLTSITRAAVTKAYDEGRVLIVSDIEGIDQYAMRYMLSSSGKIIMLVSDHMYEKRRKYARLIEEGKLLLLSIRDPYAYFDVTGALDRNITICALADLQIVTQATMNSGQVWFTSVYNLHYHWTRELVVLLDHCEDNKQLVEMGALGITKDDLLSLDSFDEIIENHPYNAQPMIDQMSIFEFIEA
ncbi:MAG: DNA-processing protein DprA [bacterium]